jgi:V8-like Glu-specific endopeptidase
MGSDQLVYPKPVSREQTEIILNQMTYGICKVYGDKEIGSGFFCLIPLEAVNMKVLITNHHVISEKFIKENKYIQINLNDGEKHISIPIHDGRKKYFNEKYDITIIQIRTADNINPQFLELDESVIYEKTEKYFKNLTIYNISYPSSNKAMVSYGLLKEVNGSKLICLCSSERSCSGSPILNLSSYRIIGLNIGSITNKDNLENKCCFLKKPIKDFINTINNSEDFRPLYHSLSKDICQNQQNQINQYNKNYLTKNSYEYENSNTINKNESNNVQNYKRMASEKIKRIPKNNNEINKGNGKIMNDDELQKDFFD